MIKLYLHNTISGKKEEFVPIDPDHVKLYACGPTVYSFAHIGNARMAIVFDTLVRFMRSVYPKVTYASNITDVDDKIIAASKQSSVPIDEITVKYTEIYNDDMAYLGAFLPDIQPRATEHIDDMIDLIKQLIDNGHAYAGEGEGAGHVLFNVPSFALYGSLSGRNRDEQIAGARVEVAPYKKDPADFILWKPSLDDEPGWDSPWGYGRPGWHIECSAMSQTHLGLPFDIHGGGADLKFPHHENEIAQSCCANGHQDDITSFAKYWIHNGFLTVEGDKMSKSLGNITLVHELREKYHGEVLRMTLLSAHYRQPLDWSHSTIEQSKKNLDRLYKVLYELRDVEVNEVEVLDPENEIVKALADDLNTPKAFAALNALSKAALAASDDQKPFYKSQLMLAGKLLGIMQDDPAWWCGYVLRAETLHLISGIDAAEIDELVAERNQARADKNFARADEIRDELAAQGIVIEDGAGGTSWRKIS